MLGFIERVSVIEVLDRFLLTWLARLCMILFANEWATEDPGWHSLGSLLRSFIDPLCLQQICILLPFCRMFSKLVIPLAGACNLSLRNYVSAPH